MKAFEHLQTELKASQEAGTYRRLTDLASAQGSMVTINGREVIQLSSNNYLGLTNHPKLKQAATEAIEKWGVGTGSVRTIAGTFTIHEAFEQELAKFKHTEAALVFQSGFTANVGVIASILSEADIVISDELNHASIIDGIRLTKAQRAIYHHSDMEHLEQVLQKAQSARTRLVVTDGVFSMDGDIAKLPEIVELCEKYDAIVMVDDAHASGVLGKQGRGTVDHFDLHGRVQIQIGTLSKAIGVLGGYVAGPQVLRDYLIQRARPFLFSTSHPPAVTAACHTALQVLQTEENWIEQLWENTRNFKSKLTKLGFDLGASETPITPIMVGDEALTMRFSDELLQAGVYAQGIAFPTVAKGKARIRTMMTAQHTQTEIDTALSAIEQTGRKLGLI